MEHERLRQENERLRKENEVLLGSLRQLTEGLEHGRNDLLESMLQLVRAASREETPDKACLGSVSLSQRQLRLYISFMGRAVDIARTVLPDVEAVAQTRKGCLPCWPISQRVLPHRLPRHHLLQGPLTHLPPHISSQKG